MSEAAGSTSNIPQLPPVFGRTSLSDTWDAAVLLVDKPVGITSFGVVKRIRHRVPVRKVGHAGTLDPMATGLLIVLVGRATKSMEAFMGQDKVYQGTIRLGEVTPSYDAESEVTERKDTDHLSDDDIRTATRPFTGLIEQRPPSYSAIKVGGERLYKKARRGEDVELPLRSVRVDAFEIGERRGADVDFRVACSKGTYIRSLAHDLGAELGVGGHLVRLRRTAIGDYDVSNAWDLNDLLAALEEQQDG
ncbi:MAG: tRNA pseudouridine(55) synthase TruB [Rhodothermales bacterium]|nr:tRNA pseudouridine(55) synthase TruB [Rhodothermales bacterium]